MRNVPGCRVGYGTRAAVGGRGGAWGRVVSGREDGGESLVGGWMGERRGGGLRAEEEGVAG